MDWLTQDHIKQEAARGPLPALLCSIEHHEQVQAASWEELRAIGKDILDQNNCALCSHYAMDNLESCPLFSGGIWGCFCCREWGNARDVWPILPDGLPTFKAAHKKLLERLYKERDKIMSKIEIEIKDDGKTISLADISEETLLKAQKRAVYEREKPEELRHGEMVVGSGRNYLAIEQSPASNYIDIWGSHSNGQGYKNGTVSRTSSYYKSIGINIFDDLEMLGKDCDHFQQECDNGEVITTSTHGDEIWIVIDNRCRELSLDTAKQFSNKFRQVIASVERKDKDG